MKDKLKPEWNPTWKRWEVPDEDSDAMRGLEYADLSVIADNQIRANGLEPGLHEDWVNEIVAKLGRKYKLQKPFPKWIKKAAEDIMENSGVDVPRHSCLSKKESGWYDYRDAIMDIIRKHSHQ